MNYRPAVASDFDNIYQLRSEENNLYWTGYENPPDYASFREWYAERLLDDKRHIFVFHDKEVFVGFLNFDLYESYIAIGYNVTHKSQGKGYGTQIVQGAIKEAFKKKSAKLTKIIAWISEKNIASQKVARRNGFVKSDTVDIRERHGVKEQYFRFEFDLATG
jgi:RimJ/RimL family protein N-acetyltransferase